MHPSSKSASFKTTARIVHSEMPDLKPISYAYSIESLSFFARS